MRRYRKYILVAIGIIFSCLAGYGDQIHEAAKSGDLNTLRQLLDADKGLLYVKDEMGKTALHWATGRSQPEAMKLLLDVYGVDVNVRNDNQGTPLHVGASQANPQGILILIEHGADINARTKDGATPLHFAALKRRPGHLEAAKILLEHGADVNAKSDNGATPLAMAQFSGNAKMVDLLRQYGARPVQAGKRSPYQSQEAASN